MATRLDAATLNQYQWAKELKRCKADFEYLCATYFRIKSKQTIGMPTLKLNRVQRHLAKKMWEQQKRTGRIRQVWGKARQVGASTLMRAAVSRCVLFKENRNATLIAHDEPSAGELFDTDKTFFDCLPAQLQPPIKYDSRWKMEYEGLRSKTLANHARNLHVGASQMAHIVHLTEAARYPNPDEVQASLFPSISDATDYYTFLDCSMVVIESTSRFGGEWFKRFGEAAIRGDTDYDFVFVPWFMHEDYTDPVGPTFEPDLEEQQLINAHGLTMGNLVWRRRKRAEYAAANRLGFFDQEFPTSWEASWIMPEGTVRVFNAHWLNSTYSALRPGRYMHPTSAGLTSHVAGQLEVWQEPIEGIYYDIGVDPSGGASANADFTAVEVIRRDTYEQVAESCFHWNPASAEFLDFMYWLGMLYNRGQIIPDTTAGWGQALITSLQARSYPALWQWRRPDDARERVSSRVGFLYTKREKANLVNRAAIITMRDQPLVHSRRLWQEADDFLQFGLEEWGAPPGKHDDCINAFMLAILASHGERPHDTPADVQRPLKSYQPKWAFHDIDKELRAPVDSQYRRTPFTTTH